MASLSELSFLKVRQHGRRDVRARRPMPAPLWRVRRAHIEHRGVGLDRLAGTQEQQASLFARHGGHELLGLIERGPQLAHDCIRIDRGISSELA
jgi:hypothetical protein